MGRRKEEKLKERRFGGHRNAGKFWRVIGVEMAEDRYVVADNIVSLVMKVIHVGFLGLNEREGAKGYLGFLMGKKDLGLIFGRFLL